MSEGTWDHLLWCEDHKRVERAVERDAPTEGLREAIRASRPVTSCNCGCWDTFDGDAIERAALSTTPPAPEGFARCPLCGDIERIEDIVGGVCLTCADGIAFSQNARRGAIVVEIETD